VNQPKQIISFVAFVAAWAMALLVADRADPLLLIYVLAVTAVIYHLLTQIFDVAQTPTVIVLPKGKPLTRVQKWLFLPERKMRIFKYWWSKRSRS
jgi:hypothetical protein